MTIMVRHEQPGHDGGRAPWAIQAHVVPSVPAGKRTDQLPARSRIATGRADAVLIEVEVEGDAPDWLTPTVETMERLLDLPEGWDSYGARPISPDAVARAIELLGATMHPQTPPPIVGPTVHGGIQLEWHTRGIDLEVERLSATRVHVFYQDRRRGAEWEGELETDFMPLADFLSELAHRS